MTGNFVVATSDDIAIIPFLESDGYRFQVNETDFKNYAGVLPRTLLCNPACEAQCIEILTRQFAAIPLATIEAYPADYKDRYERVVASARDMKQRPDHYARVHFEKMREQALQYNEQHGEPKFSPSAEQYTCIEAGLNACPKWVGDLIRAEGTPIILDSTVANKAAVASLMASDTGGPIMAAMAMGYLQKDAVLEDTTIGAAAPNVLYFRTSMLHGRRDGKVANIAYMSEEFMHHAETGVAGPYIDYSASPAWRDAIMRDMSAGLGPPRNQAYKWIVGKLKGYISGGDFDGKTNTVLDSSRPLPLTGGDEVDADHAEALADVYHACCLVRQEIDRAKGRGVKIGANIFGKGGVVCTTAEQILAEALPRTSQLVLGASDGNKLVRGVIAGDGLDVGDILQMSATRNVGPNLVPVPSLRDCCEAEASRLNAVVRMAGVLTQGMPPIPSINGSGYTAPPGRSSESGIQR